MVIFGLLVAVTAVLYDVYTFPALICKSKWCSCRWGETVLYAATSGPVIYPPDDVNMESHSEMILTGENRRTCRETCLSATLSTTNPTWSDSGANPDLHSEGLATNHLHCGLAPKWMIVWSVVWNLKTLSNKYEFSMCVVTHFNFLSPPFSLRK
jgi:hypothetical protein